MTLEYKGFGESVNEKPNGDYIQIWVSDWNKDYWGFYAYIDLDNYEEDIEDIIELYEKLNWRDGDWYIELIDCTEGVKGFYHYLYYIGEYTHQEVLEIRYWEVLKEKGDDFFEYHQKYCGSTDFSDLESMEVSVYEDWYEVLEAYNPELYGFLDENNALSSFDIGHFYNCSGFYEESDCIVWVGG